MLGAEESGDAVAVLDSAYDLINTLNMDKEEPSYMETQRATTALQHRVLMLLAKASLDVKQPKTSLNCIVMIRGLRQSPEAAATETPIIANHDNDTEHYSLAYIAMRAHILLGQADAAAEELHTLATHTQTPTGLCLKAMGEMIELGGQVKAVTAATMALRERHQGDVSISVAAAQLLLSGTNGNNAGPEEEEAALSLARDEELMQALSKDGEASQNLKTQLHTVLWNQGTLHFQGKEYVPAQELYKAAMLFADGSIRAKAARTLAICALALKDHDRALQYLEVAAQSQPGSVHTEFVRVKVHLEKGDAEAAVCQIGRLIACDGFDPVMLQAVCLEALNAKAYGVAKSALLQLHDQLVKGAFDSESGEEAVILQNLIKITGDAPRAAPINAAQLSSSEGTGSEASLPPGANITCHEELTKYHGIATSRLSKKGCDDFFGTSPKVPPGLKSASPDWFSDHAWNAAITASEDQHWQAASVLFGSSAQYQASRANPTAAQLQKQMMASAMGTSAALEAHRADAVNKAALRVASQMLSATHKALQALEQHPEVPAANPKFLVFLNLQEFDLAHREQAPERQLAALRGLESQSGAGASNLLRAAAICDEPNMASPNMRVQRSVYEAALATLKKEVQPEYPLIAMMVRRLLDLAEAETDRLALFEDTIEMVQHDSYPSKEVQRLVVQCWNRGCHHANFNRIPLAARFLAAALKLVDACPELRHRKVELAKAHEALVARMIPTGPPKTPAAADNRRSGGGATKASDTTPTT